VPLERVRIEGIRCVERAELELGSEQTYIYGPNGAGKTTLLEAIYLLSRGRSFRTRQSKRLIRRGAAELTVLGELAGATGRHRVAVRLSQAGLETRLDGQNNPGVAELARILPVHVIDPNVHELIEGGPSKRRRFLDWGVFHVEQGFLEAWRRFRRCLGQRNAALKSAGSTEPWDRALVDAAEQVHGARKRYLEGLAVSVARYGDVLIGQGLALGYRPGWPAGQSYAEALKASIDRDRTIGLTHVGPHRADLLISLDERAVREEASRGQQKLIAAALVLGQVDAFAQTHGQGGVLLIDDPAAELDASAFRALREALSTLPAQLVLTGLSEDALPPEPGAAVFHVEQGKIRGVV